MQGKARNYIQLFAISGFFDSSGNATMSMNVVRPILGDLEDFVSNLDGHTGSERVETTAFRCRTFVTKFQEIGGTKFLPSWNVGVLGKSGIFASFGDHLGAHDIDS